MLSIYDVSLNIRGKDSNNLLISKLALMIVCIFSYIYFFLDLAFLPKMKSFHQ